MQFVHFSNFYKHSKLSVMMSFLSMAVFKLVRLFRHNPSFLLCGVGALFTNQGDQDDKLIREANRTAYRKVRT